MSYDTRLREARKRAGLTQEELGKLVGCAKTTITGYETGKSEPNMAILSKIMEALKVDANFIFQDEMREHYEYHATTEEMESLVKKYRLVDNSWKQVILNILDLATAASKEPKTIIKFPQRVPDRDDSVEQDSNAIEFSDGATVKISEQPMAAGSGVYLGPESFTEYRVQDNELIRRTAFAVPVSGDSMEPKFHDGDIALVNFEPAEPGDIVVAGTNFGCGSSREHAAMTLKGAGVGAVLAESFGRIFFRNAINLGLPVIVCPGISKCAQKGDEIRIDIETGEVTDVTRGKVLKTTPFSPYVLNILESGGIKNMIRKSLMGKA